ncbi:MAG: hypothetical protein H0X16_11890 [Chloroflexi bacterium]|nr:hypothetical protein [Chloroflexota bacterium]
MATSSQDHEVRAYDGDYGTLDNARAFTTCEWASPQFGGTGILEWCDEQLLYYNNGTYPGNYNELLEVKHFACHELGHTLGLRHNDTYGPTNAESCMYNGSFTSGVNTQGHDVYCINLGYEQGIRC